MFCTLFGLGAARLVEEPVASMLIYSRPMTNTGERVSGYLNVVAGTVKCIIGQNIPF